MLTALIAAVAGIAGLVIGRLWDTRSESARWRRDRRVRSYEEVAAEFYRFREAVRLLAMLDPAAPDFGAQRTQVEGAYAEWNRILSALLLHGAETVVAAAIRIDHEFNELLSEAMRTTVDWTSWPRLREPLYASFDDYVDAVRHDLSLPRLVALRAGAEPKPARPKPCFTSTGRPAAGPDDDRPRWRLVAAGRSNRQIATTLFISAKTASVHVSNILAKFGVTSRGEAAAAAHRLGLFDDRTAI